MRQYSFLNENVMCAAGLTAYETPATVGETFQDVHHKKQNKRKKKTKIVIPNALKR